MALSMPPPLGREDAFAGISIIYLNPLLNAKTKAMACLIRPYGPCHVGQSAVPRTFAALCDCSGNEHCEYCSMPASAEPSILIVSGRCQWRPRRSETEMHEARHHAQRSARPRPSIIGVFVLHRAAAQSQRLPMTKEEQTLGPDGLSLLVKSLMA